MYLPVVLCFVVLIFWNKWVSADLQWTYGTGACTDTSFCPPSEWGSISHTCKDTDSHFQSPVNIVSGAVVIDNYMQDPIPNASSDCVEWNQYITSSSVLHIDIDSSICPFTLSFEDNDYYLISMEFHSPSEHTLGGGRYAGEVQLLHVNYETQNFIMVSVFLHATEASDLSGVSNRFLNAVWAATGYNSSNGTVNVNHATTALNPYSSLFPSNPAQYSYFGTQTSPPCSPVSWYLYEEPALLTTTDLDFLRAIVRAPNYGTLSSEGDNNRPVYPLHGREVKYSPGGVRPTWAPSPSPSRRPTAKPTRAPTVFIHPGPYKVKVKSAMIVACLALTLSGLIILAVVGWQLYAAITEKRYVRLKAGERETALPV